MRTSVGEASNAAIEDKMKCWLRQARDRDGRKRHYEAAEARKRQRVSGESAEWRSFTVVVRGHLRSWAVSPFSRPHTISCCFEFCTVTQHYDWKFCILPHSISQRQFSSADTVLYCCAIFCVYIYFRIFPTHVLMFCGLYLSAFVMTMQKWLNQLRCHLAPPGEYDWFV